MTVFTMAALKWIALALALLVIAVSAAVFCGSWHWNRETVKMRARLEAARQSPLTPRYDVREIATLPAPVQRYFLAVLQDGQPVVTALSIEHTGRMNMGETVASWKPFTSSQRVIVQRPGFDWDARITMLPGVAVYVHDAYIAGAGFLFGSVFGLIPVVRMDDSVELAHGELLRYFAEAAWYPTALLPSQGVRWEPVDDRSARGTLTDGTTSVTLSFQFHPEGPIDTVRAESRSRAVGGVSVGTPWVGRFWNYQVKAGMRVPMEGEVAWMAPEGAWPYWRGTTTALSYELAE